jgi:hypothetical protein
LSFDSCHQVLTRAVVAQGEVVCSDGIPEACPYACGRIWTDFYQECQGVLSKFFENLGHFTRFTDRCLDMDPASMAMALYTASCAVCGDGARQGAEECDDGSANAEAPGAACRSNCRRARCGDEIVDPGGASSPATPYSQRHLPGGCSSS